MVEVKCKMCDYVLKVPAKKYALIKHQYVQDVFPDLSVDDRELLISGICGKCFDSMFDEDEE